MTRDKNAQREKYRQEVREWLLISVVSFTTFCIGLCLTKMVAQSGPMRVGKEISKLKGSNFHLLDEIIDVRLDKGDLDPDVAARVREYRTELKKTRELRDQYVKEDRPKEERRALMQDYSAKNEEFKELKQEIIRETSTRAEDAPGVRLAKTYLYNEKRIAELDAIPGLLYTELGPVLLILVGIGFTIIMWLGIFGIAFLFGIGGLLLLSKME